MDGIRIAPRGGENLATMNPPRANLRSSMSHKRARWIVLVLSPEVTMEKHNSVFYDFKSSTYGR